MPRLFLITFLFVPVILGAALPSVSFAIGPEQPVPPGETTYAEAYVPCGTVDKNPKDGIVDKANECGFDDVIELAKRIINAWIIAGVTFATIGFGYAGLLYITAMGSSEKISHAHSIFVKTFWGFVFMLSAWLIVYAMEAIFLNTDARCNSFLTTDKDRAELECIN